MQLSKSGGVGVREMMEVQRRGSRFKLLPMMSPSGTASGMSIGLC